MNVGTNDATFTISYAGVAGSTTSPTLHANEKYEIFQLSDPTLASVPTNWSASATITTSGEPMVCVVNESSSVRPGDQLYSYSGVIP